MSQHCLFCLLFLILLGKAAGHGRLRHPPGRSTMWRYGFHTPENVNDHELNCGGFGRQQENNGLCGVCGDPYDEPRPRQNELGGRWGLGIVTEDYLEGQALDIEVELTAYHMACLDRYLLQREGGLVRYMPRPPEEVGSRYWVRYILPPGVTCGLCVLQWRYLAGNSWGRCDNGTESIGCGPQEEFRACADLAIHSETGGYDSRPGNEIDTDGHVIDSSTTLAPAGCSVYTADLFLLILSLLVAIRSVTL